MRAEIARGVGTTLATVRGMHPRWFVVALVTLGACTVGDSPCAQVASHLDGCSTEQTEAFISACDESGGAPAASLLDDDANAACTTPIAVGSADVQTTAEVGVCVAAMYGVKWTVSALSPTGRPLDAQTKAALRPLYGALVDQVRISIGATLPPRIVIGGHELSVPPDAMTFGSNLFMLQEVASDTKRPYRLLLTTVHEMKHAQQAQQAGSYYGFAVNYCRDMVAANFDYNQIGMEVAAYGVQGTARSSLQSCGHVTCP
jgi:hypothetical protein